MLHYCCISVGKEETTMAVTTTKRRYSVSLRPAVVNRFQALAKELGIPRSSMSAACEDAIKNVSDVFQMAKEKGTIEISDLHRLFGQQLEIIEQETRDAKSAQEAKGVEKKPARRK
jgi:hypothetical protein